MRGRSGRKGEDTGVLVVLATKDRKLRILTGYGVEGILPDGLVGEIQDREMVPAFRAGRLGDGLERGVAAIAQRIAEGPRGRAGAARRRSAAASCRRSRCSCSCCWCSSSSSG